MKRTIEIIDEDLADLKKRKTALLEEHGVVEILQKVVSKELAYAMFYFKKIPEWEGLKVRDAELNVPVWSSWTGGVKGCLDHESKLRDAAIIRKEPLTITVWNDVWTSPKKREVSYEVVKKVISDDDVKEEVSFSLHNPDGISHGDVPGEIYWRGMIHFDVQFVTLDEKNAVGGGLPEHNDVGN